MKRYLSIARLDNWSKNLSMLGGAGLAYLLADKPLSIDWLILIKGMVALCLASSANYTINEYIDARFDRFHPIKRKRAGVREKLSGKVVAGQYFILAIAALLVSYSAHLHVVLVILVYLVGAWFYNIPPVRIKDIAYWDVALESSNYPLRILVGWLCILPFSFPPSSTILIAWTVGAFMMSVKRLAEYQVFKKPSQAAAYRKAYKTYNVKKLILASFVYAMLSSFGITVFLLKYRIEFILTLPLISVWFALYLGLGLGKDQIAIYPERLLKQRDLVMLSVIILLLLIIAAKVDLPQLHILYQPLKF